MPPVKGFSGFYSGKDIIFDTDEEDRESPHIYMPLMNTSFENSYGKPWVGKSFWTPKIYQERNPKLRLPAELPPIDDHPFEAIMLDITIRSKGHQYDRLATIWIDDTEIMRLSTPEPTDEGVVSYISKDLSPYGALFKHDPNKCLPSLFSTWEISSLTYMMHPSTSPSMHTFTDQTRQSPSPKFIITKTWTAYPPWLNKPSPSARHEARQEASQVPGPSQAKRRGRTSVYPKLPKEPFLQWPLPARLMRSFGGHMYRSLPLDTSTALRSSLV